MKNKNSCKEKQKKLCERVNISISDDALLQQALTHTSFAHESKSDPKPGHNERLEFLGDAVLSLSVSTYIYNRYPEMDEGEMTKLRAKVVCETALAQYAREIELGDCLFLGKGEEVSGGNNRSSILADAVEALIGAVYVDNGWQQAYDLAIFLTKNELDKLALSDDTYDDYKTKLQELVQKSGNVSVTYKLISESGPSHSKIFNMAVYINGEEIASGKGMSKKEAEQLAAKTALEKV